MFLSELTFRRAVHLSARKLIRSRTKMPGASYTLKELDAEGERAFINDPEGFGDLDANFNKVGASFNQHKKEMKDIRDKIRQFMVKHKYFRGQHLPNLLTYAEKEQMRTLNAQDPDEWTAERLSESFPATPDIVEKILKAKWRPTSVERIRKHDEVVIKNWGKIKKNNENIFQLPPALLEHLKKFSERNRHDLNQTAIDLYGSLKRFESLTPKNQEFLSIITSCKKYADTVKELPSPAQSIETQSNLELAKDAENGTYLMDEIKDKRKMRLQELKKLKLTPSEWEHLESTKDYSSDTNDIERSTDQENDLRPVGSNKSSSLSDAFIHKFQESEIVISKEDQNRYQITKVKDRVYIPKKLWRKGATFRVEDCYYDDDGFFLYRVPGMK